METRSALEGKSIAQLVAFFGDGALTEASTCSIELRSYLEAAPFEKLAEHARFCLEQKFEKCVLQDIVNEIGRRLGYQVTNGRYSGTRSAIGFDGLWFDGKRHLIVEVKTTDAYRINLDTIAEYSRRIREEKKIDEAMTSGLIVVGRQDTGDLEAQVRGSRHAWSVRLISVEALLKLAQLNDSVDDPGLVAKIRTVVLPFEYTRVDDIIDLVFETQLETEIQAVAEDLESEERSKTEEGISKPAEKRRSESTPKTLLDAKRTKIVESFFRDRNRPFNRVSKTNFEDPETGLRVSCAVSKLYETSTPGYWYAFHPPWLEFLRGGKESFFLLGCMDREEAYAIPLRLLEDQLVNLNQTIAGEKYYWHIYLRIDGNGMNWKMLKAPSIPLSNMKFDIS
jgi:hypothetical protein